MDDNERWESGEPYKFPFNVNKHENGNIFKGSSSSVFPRDDNVNNIRGIDYERDTNLHAMYMDDDEASIYGLTSSSSSFDPFFKIPLGLDLRPNSNFEVGSYMGEPLLSWLVKSRTIEWETDDDNNYLRIGAKWRMLGRWLGSALTKEHENDTFVGDLLNSTFVDDKGKKVTFAKNVKRNLKLRPEFGITEDLKNLNHLVHLIEAQIQNPQGSVLHDIEVYKKLFPDHSLPQDLEGLKNVSYFLCNNFLYFEAEHRFSFCSVYRKLRQTNKKFSNEVKIVGGDNKLDQNWDAHLPKNGILYGIYTFQQTAHQGRHGLVHFHRSCKEHYNQNARRHRQQLLSDQQLDQKLLSLFPDAIPKVYSALVKSSKYSKNLIQLIDALKLEGLDFSQEM